MFVLEINLHAWHNWPSIDWMDICESYLSMHVLSNATMIHSMSLGSLSVFINNFLFGNRYLVSIIWSAKNLHFRGPVDDWSGIIIVSFYDIHVNVLATLDWNATACGRFSYEWPFITRYRHIFLFAAFDWMIVVNYF